MNIIHRVTGQIRRIGIGWSAIATLLPVVVSAGLHFSISRQIDEQSLRNQMLHDEIEVQDGKIHELRSLEDLLAEYQIRRVFLRGAEEWIERSVSLLSDLSQLPEGVSLSRVSLDRERLQLEGRAEKLADIGIAASTLHHAQATTRVVVTQSQREGDSAYRFAMTADVAQTQQDDAL